MIKNVPEGALELIVEANQLLVFNLQGIICMMTDAKTSTFHNALDVLLKFDFFILQVINNGVFARAWIICILSRCWQLLEAQGLVRLISEWWMLNNTSYGRFTLARNIWGPHAGIRLVNELFLVKVGQIYISTFQCFHPTPHASYHEFSLVLLLSLVVLRHISVFGLEVATL